MAGRWASAEKLAFLYDEILELLLEGRHRDGGEPIPAQDDVRQALRFLAHGMTEDDCWAEPPRRLESRLRAGEPELLRQLRTEPDWNRNLQRFFNDIYERTHILGPHDGRREDWRFWHRTFREALTAELLWSRHGADTLDWTRWCRGFGIYLTTRLGVTTQIPTPKRQAKAAGQSRWPYWPDVSLSLMRW